MDKSVEAVFRCAVMLLGEADENGDMCAAEDLRVRTLGILNSVLSECYRADPSYDARVPIDDLTDFADAVPLDDAIVRAMSFRLAAEWCRSEDLTLSSSFLTQYYTALADARRGQTAEFEPIRDVY